MSSSTYDKKTFDNEIESWCYGLRNYPGEIYTELISALFDEIAPSFHEMIKTGQPFNVLEIAEKFVEASHYIIDHYTITKLICQKFPNPNNLTDMDMLYTIAQMLDEIEKQYVGFQEVMERFWNSTPTPQEAA